MESERLHDVKFLEKYENRVACENFISATGDYFFSEFVKSRLEPGFIGFLNDGTLDTFTTEQEVLCHFS